MQRVLLIPGTIFLHFQPTGGVLLVLPGAVIAALALGAGQNDINTHMLLDDFGHHAGTNCAATFTNGETQAGFHSDGVDELNDEL